MRGLLYARRSVLLVMIMVSMLVVSACDTAPATPVPNPTQVQSVAPTATAQSSNNNQATPGPGGPAPGGKLGTSKAGTVTGVTRSAGKGELASEKLGQAKHDTTFDALDRSTPTTTNPEPTATEAPAGNPTGVPEDWSIVLDSDFSDDDPGAWELGQGDGFATTIENGKLTLTAEDGVGFFKWTEETINWTDGYISATVELDGAGSVGLLARFGKSGGKFNDLICLINSNGNYGCYSEVDGKTTKAASGRSSAMKKTGVNELALLGIGESFSFIVNGKSVKTFAEKNLTEGAWGLYLESPSGETTNAAFSRILFMGPGEEPVEPTETPEPDIATETPEPDNPATETPEPGGATSTPRPGGGTATPTAATEEDVILSTDFSEDAGTWLMGEGEGFSVSVVDGELVVASTSPSGVVGTAAEEALDVTDARIEATVRVEDGSTDKPGLVGVSGRSQEFASGFEDWSQVFCGINVNGAYSCNRLTKGSGGSVNFKEVLHGETDAIVKDGQNTLALTGKGSRWTFEINGTKVGSFTDNSVKTGAWGVLVLAGDSDTTGFFSKVDIFKR